MFFIRIFILKKSIILFYFSIFSFLNFIQSHQKAFFDFAEGKAIPLKHFPTVVVAEGSSDQRLYQKVEDDFTENIYEQEFLLTPPAEVVSILLLSQKKVAPKTFVPIKEVFQCPGCEKNLQLFYLRHYKEKVCFLPKKDPRINCCFCLKSVCVRALSQHLNLEHFNTKVLVGGFPDITMENV